MEAKELLKEWSKGHSIKDEMVPGLLKLAEISFKAGKEEEQKSWTNELKQSWKQAGMKEVVSQMALERCDPDVMPYFEDYYYIPKSVLQAKLKEWGIEK